MDQFKRFGVDTDNDNFMQSSIYGIACVYSVIEREIENTLKKFNFSTSKFNILMVIKHHAGENGISQIEIGKRLVVTASNMTKQLDKLHAEGLIERTAQKGDRRVNLIKITQQGSDLLDTIWPKYFEKIQELANMIDDKERQQLSETLAKWFDKLENK